MSTAPSHTSWIPLAPEELGDIFDPDFGLDEAKFTPEKRLYLAILLRAIHDAQGDVAGIAGLPPARRARVREQEMADAWAWLESEAAVDPRTAEEICRLLQLDRAAIAAEMRRGPLAFPTGASRIVYATRSQLMSRGRKRRSSAYFAAMRQRSARSAGPRGAA